MANADVNTSVQRVPKQTGLKHLTEKFRETIFNQHNLLALAKKTAIEEDSPTIEALTISIGRFNDDLYLLYQELDEIANSVAEKGGA